MTDVINTKEVTNEKVEIFQQGKDTNHYAFIDIVKVFNVE
jgi:hypothetical protein